MTQRGVMGLKKHLSKRLTNLFIIIVIISLGLLSRLINAVPLYVGDMLWAVMIYFIIKIIWYNLHPYRAGAIGLIICYSVEFSQLYQAEWINQIRATLPGRLILGRGFLWSDILAYTVGIAIVVLLDRIYLRKRYESI